MVKNIYQNLPTDEKTKLYLRFCDYLTREQTAHLRNHVADPENPPHIMPEIPKQTAPRHR